MYVVKEGELRVIQEIRVPFQGPLARVLSHFLSSGRVVECENPRDSFHSHQSWASDSEESPRIHPDQLNQGLHSCSTNSSSSQQRPPELPFLRSFSSTSRSVNGFSPMFAGRQQSVFVEIGLLGIFRCFQFPFSARGSAFLLPDVCNSAHLRLFCLVLGPFSLFGEVSCLMRCPRTASVISLTPCTLLQIRRLDCCRHLEKSSKLYAHLMNRISKYPTEDDLQRLLAKDICWQEYKGQLVTLAQNGARRHQGRRLDLAPFPVLLRVDSKQALELQVCQEPRAPPVDNPLNSLVSKEKHDGFNQTQSDFGGKQRIGGQPHYAATTFAYRSLRDTGTPSPSPPPFPPRGSLRRPRTSPDTGHSHSARPSSSLYPQFGKFPGSFRIQGNFSRSHDFSRHGPSSPVHLPFAFDSRHSFRQSPAL